MKFTIQNWFESGMKRTLPDLIQNHGIQIELGPGNNPIPFCDMYFDKGFLNNTESKIKWDADDKIFPNHIPIEDCSVDVIHAHHIFEHVNDPTALLKDCERVLKIGGHINIVVPHWKCELAFEDIDHKHRFAEGTWNNILNNQGYEKEIKFNLKIYINFVMAIVERNTAIFTQLIKIGG